MKQIIIIFSLFFCEQSYSQLSVSIDSLSGFSCFDSITELHVWREQKIYFPDSTLKEDIRFRIWGDGCAISSAPSSRGKKCFYKFQRQTYFEGSKIKEKEGAYGWHVNSNTMSIYHQMIYNKKGKLLYVQKVKHK